MNTSGAFKEASSLFIKIDVAPSVDDAAPHVEAVWKLSETLGAPFKLFVPFLVQRNFPAQIFDRIVATLLKSDADQAKQNENPDPSRAAIIYDAKAGRAHLLLHSVCNFLIGLSHTRTAADNNTDIFTAATTIARGTSAFNTAVETGCFLMPFVKKNDNASSSSSAFSSGSTSTSSATTTSRSGGNSGTINAVELSKTTLVGALLALNMFKNGTGEHAQVIQKAKWYPFDPATRQFDDRLRDASDVEIHQALKNQTDRCKALLDACLRSSSENRERTFRFIAKVLECNRDYKKTQPNEAILFDRFALVAIALAMLQLASPILGQRDFFPRGLNPAYLQDKENPNTIIRYHENDDLVIGRANATALPHDVHSASPPSSPASSPPSPPQPLPPSQDAAAASSPSSAFHVYAPKYHIFFIALFAFDLAFGTLSSSARGISRWLGQVARGRSPQQALGIAGLLGYLSALITSPEGSALVLRFTDAVAEWLLFVSGADRDGNVAEISAYWALLPQSIIDTVFESLTYSVVETRDLFRNPPLQRSGYFEFTNCVSLALLLMGNARLLPKAFTHLQYPDFFYYLLHAHGGNFRNHQWFVSHALTDCIECYIIVDSQEYDKISQRNILGEIMKDLLNDPQAVAAVREKFDASNERILERLTKIMTGDADFCLHLVIKGLGVMHEIEDGLQGAIPQQAGDDLNKYNESKREVRDGVILSKTILVLFTRLLDQFKKGMAQHLVVQQVGQLLVTFLVKLAGPESAKLKCLSAEEVGFNPRELVELIVEAFIRFHDVPGFSRYCVEGTQDMGTFFDAVSRIKRLNIISSHLMMGLVSMELQMKAAEEESKLDESVYNDPPEWAQCQIFYTLLEDPVELPGGGEDPVVCNREAIRHQLLDRPFNPYNRQPLTVEELDAHNKMPEILTKMQALKKKVSDWKEGRRREAIKAKSQDAAQ